MATKKVKETKTEKVRNFGICMLEDGYFRITTEMKSDATIEDFKKFNKTFSDFIDILKQLEGS